MNAAPRRLRVDHAGAGSRLAGDRPGERQHHRRRRQQQQQARLPAEQIHEQVRVGKGDEAADAAGHAERGNGAGALLGRRGATDRTDQRVEPGAADADAEQHAADQQVVARLGRIHEIDAGHRRHRARRPRRGRRRSGRRSCRRRRRRGPTRGWRPPSPWRTARGRCRAPWSSAADRAPSPAAGPWRCRR